jgi:hypothetical protein
MRKLRYNNTRLFITTNQFNHPRVIDVSIRKSRPGRTRSLRTIVTSKPLFDESKVIGLDVRFRYVGKTNDPSFADKPSLFRRARIPLRIDRNGFLIVSARDSQLLYWDGTYFRFTDFMNEVVRLRPAVVALIDQKQKKPHLIADFQQAKDGSFSLLDGHGRSLGHVNPGEEPAVIHSNLLASFSEKGNAIVRVEIALNQA